MRPRLSDAKKRALLNPVILLFLTVCLLTLGFIFLYALGILMGWTR